MSTGTRCFDSAHALVPDLVRTAVVEACGYQPRAEASQVCSEEKKLGDSDVSSWWIVKTGVPDR